jgi:alpha,alpha-trehalase
VRDAWKEEADAFTPYVGSSTLDASNLMMAIVGLLPAADPRMLATIAATWAGVSLPHRRWSQRLAGEEGTFLPCTRWLAQDSRWPIRLIEPRTGCERATAVANDLGLLAEELDPELPSGSATSRKHLVNWPG